jgi:hypothetical protein
LRNIGCETLLKVKNFEKNVENYLFFEKNSEKSFKKFFEKNCKKNFEKNLEKKN